MTCIIGYIDKQNKIMYMGGDSAGVSGLNIHVRSDVKVFKRKDMLIGYTSSFRMGQLLRFKLEIPVCKDKDVYKYMCTDFIDAVRKCLKDNGYAEVSNNKENIGTFLVAYKGRLFKVESDLQVGEHILPYDACGCGEEYALGAIRALENYSKEIYSVKDQVEFGLKVATDFSGGIKPPFIIEKQEY